MGVTFRPFVKNDDDYAFLARVYNETWPDHIMPVEMLKHDDETQRPDLLMARFVLLLDGAPVGTGLYFESKWTYVPGKYSINIMVLPEYRGRGVGTAFYQKALADLATREPRPIALTGSSRENQTGGVRFLEKHGFKLTMRYPISTLGVQPFDVAKYKPLLQRVAESRIEIKSLAELIVDNPEAKRLAYELCELQVMGDVPSTDPYTPESFEEFTKSFYGHPGFRPEAMFIAVDDGRYVGLSMLFQRVGQPEKYMTGITGVIRSHRRRGLAKVLKVYAIRYAQANGAQIIETDNEENNPMYDLNMQLGFAPQPAWVDYERPWDGAMNK